VSLCVGAALTSTSIFYDTHADFLGLVGDFSKFQSTFPDEGAVVVVSIINSVLCLSSGSLASHRRSATSPIRSHIILATVIWDLFYLHIIPTLALAIHSFDLVRFYCFYCIECILLCILSVSNEGERETESEVSDQCTSRFNLIGLLQPARPHHVSLLRMCLRASNRTKTLA